MIPSVSKLFLAALVFNIASVVAAPIRQAVPAAVEARDSEQVSSPAARSIVDVPVTRRDSPTASRRTFSRRQARLVERQPELEQPVLEARDTPVAQGPRAVEPRNDVLVHRRYPRRIYYEHYEKRSPDAMNNGDETGSKVDGCPCNNANGIRSLVSVVRLFERCPCAVSPPAMPQSQPKPCMGGGCVPPPMQMPSGETSMKMTVTLTDAPAPTSNPMSCPGGPCSGSSMSSPMTNPSMMPPMSNMPPPMMSWQGHNMPPPCNHNVPPPYNNMMPPPASMPPMKDPNMMPPMKDPNMMPPLASMPPMDNHGMSNPGMMPPMNNPDMMSSAPPSMMTPPTGASTATTSIVTSMPTATGPDPSAATPTGPPTSTDATPGAPKPTGMGDASNPPAGTPASTDTSGDASGGSSPSSSPSGSPTPPSTDPTATGAASSASSASPSADPPSSGESSSSGDSSSSKDSSPGGGSSEPTKRSSSAGVVSRFLGQWKRAASDVNGSVVKRQPAYSGAVHASFLRRRVT